MLEVKNLVIHYGGVKAVQDISFQVPDGKVVTLVGANGAGKTSTLRSIIGLVKAKGGSIMLDGEEICGKATDQIVRRGITLVPEGRHVFPDQTVEENLRLGAYLRVDGGIRDDMERVYRMFPRLKERPNRLAGTMSGGEQQMVAIGRALMSRPKIMMMDEPSLGLAPIIIKDLFKIIKEINQEGMTILLVEQNANMALAAADYAYVIENGRITMEGAGGELLVDPRVKAAYLGGS